jgi:capsular exopolysaccharide synthesis family protein
MAGGVALLMEYLDDRLNSPEELRAITRLRVLAKVPLMAADQPRLMAALPSNSVAAESYRALRAGVGFASVDHPIRRLQITSPSPGEGKSTTAVNLATAMARNGKTVILVDADLRSPRLHELLDVDHSPGLSEVLAGMESLEDALRATPIENLTVVPAGYLPPEPAELLGSPVFDQVLDQLAARADVLIVDTPPCVPLTDPLLVAPRMDGVVLVIHAGHTSKAAVRQALDLLEHARAHVIGAVFNRVQPHGSAYPSYGYIYAQSGHTNGARHRSEISPRNGKTPPPEVDDALKRATVLHGVDEER